MPSKPSRSRRGLFSSPAPHAALALLATALGGARTASAATSVPVVPIAVYGQAAPGTGLPFYQPFPPRINGAGQVAFSAQIGTVAERAESLWIWENGSLQLVAAEGDSAPGTGAGYARFAVLGLNDAGEMVIAGKLAGPGVTTANDEAFFAGTAGDYALAVREGSPLAAGSPELVTGVSTIELGDEGDVLQAVHLGTSGSVFSPNAAVWGAPGAMTAVATQMPLSLGFTGSGQGYLALDSTSGVDDRMLAGPLAAPAEIWHQEDPFSPVSGATLTTLDGTMSEAGGLFSVYLGGPEHWALAAWSESDGFEALLRDGDTAPGHPDLRFESADPRRLVIGSNGDVAGLALLRDTANSSFMSLFSGSLAGGVEIALAEGDSAPGIAGAVIQTIAEISNVTDQGLFVFSAWVQPSGGGDLVQALYARRPDGTIDLLLQTGDTIEWRESRVVDFFTFVNRSGSDPGGNRNDRALNDAGQLALEISHGGRSGAYLLDVTVPEPASAWLVPSGLLVLRWARPRARRS